MAWIKWGGIIIGVLIALQGIQTADAAQSESKVKVGISPFSPFVYLKGEEPTGASIDFWRMVALKLDIDYEFVECTGVVDKLNRLQEGQIDIAIGGIVGDDCDNGDSYDDGSRHPAHNDPVEHYQEDAEDDLEDDISDDYIHEGHYSDERYSEDSGDFFRR